MSHDNAGGIEPSSVNAGQHTVEVAVPGACSPETEQSGATQGGTPAWRILTATLSLVIFVACAWYVAVSFEWKSIWEVVSRANLAWLLLGGGVSIIIYWVLRAARWYLLVRSLGVRIRFVDLYLCSTVSLSLSIFTPLSSGETIKVELLKKHGALTRSEGYGSFLLERGLDLFVVVVIGCVSLLSRFGFLHGRSTAYWVLAVAVFAGALGLFTLRRVRLRGRLGEVIGCMTSCVNDWRTISCVAVLTLASWCTVGLSWEILLHSIGINLGFADAMALMSLVALVSILSFIPGGLGISEAGISQVLTRFGYDAVTAQSGAVILRSYTIMVGLLGIIHLVLWRLENARRRSGIEGR